MSESGRLHPLVEYHVLNTLGWPRLRPIQELCIDPIRRGENVVVQAQTAGGKTEAAVLPVLSRVLDESFPSLSVLYVCPLRALLNNQIDRLEKLFGMVGHRAGLWHGDVTATSKKRLIQDPPTCLLTTPESLEAILTSQTIRGQEVLSRVKVVIIDEVHAFAESDRGWHLLGILSRLERLSQAPIQRIGLSATVGNPEQIGKWLDGRGRDVPVLRTAGAPVVPEVLLDFVGSLDNAAIVIHKLHAGEKRLIFCDSRSRVEELASSLRALGTKTFVIHGSLSRDERALTERAFSEEKSCVIVATSALELGIDIGDLDRVIQIDSPGRVASFLQRMGRTGRRPGTQPNCLFLATGEDELLEAAGLLSLWQSGFVEPATPPASPRHLLAQQVMALGLQTRGLQRAEIGPWLAAAQGLGAESPPLLEEIIEFALSSQILSENDGLLWLGREGEQTFGRKNFLDLLSVFLSEPQLKVFHGRQELGQVDQSLFLMQREILGKRGGESIVLTLGGRHWQVHSVQLKAKTIQVIPTDHRGKSRWLGNGRPTSFALSQAIRGVLGEAEPSSRWSSRARKAMEQLQGQGNAPTENEILANLHQDTLTLWTYAGHAGNLVLAQRLDALGLANVRSDRYCVTCSWLESSAKLPAFLADALGSIEDTTAPLISDEMLTELKFAQCLSRRMAKDLLAERGVDSEANRWLRQAKIRVVVI
ncbi:MAG: DEAD/DEAH box helicase [Fibrobacteres bacterium]|nr:DEAD/DEAH box helicase [Fibrobacterota bacterium]